MPLPSQHAQQIYSHTCGITGHEGPGLYERISAYTFENKHVLDDAIVDDVDFRGGLLHKLLRKIEELTGLKYLNFESRRHMGPVH